MFYSNAMITECQFETQFDPIDRIDIGRKFLLFSCRNFHKLNDSRRHSDDLHNILMNLEHTEYSR